MLSYFKSTVHNPKVQELEQFEVGCWIRAVDPTKEELDLLVKEYNLDLSLLEEGLDEHELPRVHFEDKETYIFVKTILPEHALLGTLLIVLSERFMITLAKEELPLIKELISKSKDFLTTQKLKCLILLFSLIDEKFEAAVNDVVKNVHKKRRTAQKLDEEDMETLLKQEEFLNNLASTYSYTNMLYAKMIKKIKFFEDDKEILEDLKIEAEQGMELCKNSLKTISNIRNYYSILLSNKLNRTIKILTLFTIILAIPAAIGGLYGMNVKLPLQDFSWTFELILTLIVICWIGFLLFLRKKGLF